MPTVDGQKFPYTRAGVAAAKKARKSKNPDAVKTKGDMMLADNVKATINNMGGGYKGLTRGYLGAT